MASTNTNKIVDLFQYNYDNYGTARDGGNRLKGWVNTGKVLDIGLIGDMESTLIGRRQPKVKSICIAQEDNMIISSKLMSVSMQNNTVSFGNFLVQTKKDGTPNEYPKWTRDDVAFDARITKSIPVKSGTDIKLVAEINPELLFTLTFEWEKPEEQKTLGFEQDEVQQTQGFEQGEVQQTQGFEPAAPIRGAAGFAARHAARKAKEADDIKQREKELLDKQREKDLAKQREKELAELIAKQEIIDKQYEDLLAQKTLLTQQRADLIAKKELAKNEVIDVCNSSDEEEELKGKAAIDAKRRVEPKPQPLGGSAKVVQERPLDPAEEYTRLLQEKVDDKYKTAITAAKVWVMDDRFEGRPPYQCDKVDKNDKPYTGFLLDGFRQTTYALWKVDNPKLDEVYSAIADQHNDLPQVKNATSRKLDANAVTKTRNAANALLRKVARNKLAQKEKVKKTHKTAKDRKQQAKDDDRSEPEPEADDESQPRKKVKRRKANVDSD